MKAKLLVDIVIPAGTIFEDAPIQTERHGSGHIEHLFAAGDHKDTFGSIHYFVGAANDHERAESSNVFEVIEE